MLQRLKPMLAAAVCMLLAACATPPVPRLEASPQAMAKVKTIAVIRVPEPKAYAVLNFGHPGMAFGLIGGMVAAADQSSKEGRLSQALKDAGFAFNDPFVNEIAGELAKAGFESCIEETSWEERDGKHWVQFNQIRSEADAVLVVTPTIIGFVATDARSDYQTTVTVVATLLGRDRNEVVHRGFYASGWIPKAQGWRYASSSKAFANFDQLVSDPKQTGESLRAAGASIAKTLASDLVRR